MEDIEFDPFNFVFKNPSILVETAIVRDEKLDPDAEGSEYYPPSDGIAAEPPTKSAEGVDVSQETLDLNIDPEVQNRAEESLVLRKDSYLHGAFLTVEALSDCILHLSIALTQLNQKSFVLQMAVENMRDVVTELNRFVNALPGISTDD